MGGNPWFRMYVDFLTDPKVIGLAFEDQRHYIGVLALKSDGQFDQAAAPGLMDKIVAQRLWIGVDNIKEVKRRLIDAGLIDKNWQPLAWAKRQFRSDTDPTNADRQRKHRAKKALQSTGGPPSNAGGNALHNGQVTGLEQNRTDTEQNTHSGVTPRSEGVCVLMREKGIQNPDPADPLLLSLLEQGATDSEITTAVLVAIAAGKPSQNYALGVVVRKRQQAGAVRLPPSMAKPWHETASGLVAKGQELGIEQGEGEPFQAFKHRVFLASDPRGAKIPPRLGESWLEWQHRVEQINLQEQAA
jgi:hypothetical protein